MARPKLPPRRSERCRLQRVQVIQVSPLLNLPAEIRNLVFGLALPSNEVFTTDPYVHSVYDDGRIQDWAFARQSFRYRRLFCLTQVCRQIRDETIKLAYATNAFSLQLRSSDSDSEARKWIESRPADVLPTMHKIALYPTSGWQDMDWCGRLHALFDLKLETAKVFYSGCANCRDYHQAKTTNFQKLVRHAVSTSTTAVERLDILI